LSIPYCRDEFFKEKAVVGPVARAERKPAHAQEFRSRLSQDRRRTGQIMFYQTPLDDVVDELNHYHRGHIVILGGP
jgi:ferric-dicitrate binding protein FerR (iron transport regulator)